VAGGGEPEREVAQPAFRATNRLRIYVVVDETDVQLMGHVIACGFFQKDGLSRRVAVGAHGQ
jgi:hypothetical protein